MSSASKMITFSHGGASYVVALRAVDGRPLPPLSPLAARSLLDAGRATSARDEPLLVRVVAPTALLAPPHRRQQVHRQATVTKV